MADNPSRDKARTKRPLKDVLALFFKISGPIFQVVKTAVVLFWDELLLAYSSTKKIIRLALVLVLLSVGAWISLVLTIMATIYWLSGNMLIATSGTTLLHFVGIFIVIRLITHYQRDLRLSHTRAMLSAKSV